MIYFHGVSKKFGAKRVLDALDLHIERGKITFILGKSGEGKSVTIKHIMGLLKPDSGSILVDGQDISLFTHEALRIYRRKFGMLFQQAALFDSMTVWENILFPLKELGHLGKGAILARSNEVLEQVGITAIKHKLPHELSTGEKKRVGLARALAAKPAILLYDEPTTGMDPLISEMIDNLIVQVSRDTQGLTSIVISHDIKAALATAQRIIMLYQGKVALAGTPAEFRATTDPLVRQFFSGKVAGPMEFL